MSSSNYPEPNPQQPDVQQSDITAFELESINDSPFTDKILGYYVKSTAPINVEDYVPSLDSELVQGEIDRIAKYLAESKNRQVVIAIHGYGTQRSDAVKRYKKIYEYAANTCQPKTSVFLGYLWPSEKPTGDDSLSKDSPQPTTDSSFRGKFFDAFNALPTLLSGIFYSGLIVSAAAAILLIITSDFNNVLMPVLFTSVLAFSILLALILLRFSTYFRDNYRATNYGVLDLVELLRRLDQAVFELTGELNKSERIKLSFIGHSMGCFVTTNAIRILSDVFDQNAIHQNPPADIGHVFSLGRLVLVAPDIPIETVMPRRANFLRSSLRRCEEAYVFSNEGDLALRLASTAANYFSFPARTRDSGYRLGNLTAKHFRNRSDHKNRKLEEKEYGIVNITDLEAGEIDDPFKRLEIRASDREHQSLEEFRGYDTIQKEKVGFTQKQTVVADLFTYFDCTDYRDQKENTAVGQKPPTGVVSFASNKAALNLVDYFRLTISYFKSALKLGGGINVHGGYFDGVWSQQVIYGFAFLGFRKFLISQSPSSDNSFSEMKVKLNDFSEQARKKGIQIVLAPIRYEKDIQIPTEVNSSLQVED
jgi:pimeloyl-ACP methyl ester carboxylesterase